MYRLCGFLALTLLLVACAKEKSAEDQLSGFDGTYAGTFNRSGMDTSNVTIKFDQRHFEGESDRAKYPAICNGSFERNGSTIVFSDSCVWTADFDWTLILNGTYTIDETESSLRIWRTNADVTDEFILTRIGR